jgi:hypothetical protein
MRRWRDVEKEQDACWNRMAAGIFEGASAHPGLCPSCGQAEVRYFYCRSGEDHCSRRGGMWIWCPACLRYNHYTAYVPEWWENLPGVSCDALAHDPEWLEEHWDELLAAGHPLGTKPKPME